MRVLFAGIGTMGAWMAKNLVAKGFDVTVYNRSETPTHWFREHGIPVVASPAEGVVNADVVITMLADDAAVRSVLLDPARGVLSRIGKDTLVIDSSTVSPGLSRELAKKFEEKGARMLDAPVTGSAPQAQAGTLTFIVGGRPEDFERATPLFAAMGKKWFHVGPAGSGSVAKLANNTMVALNMMAVMEGLAVAEAGGIDRRQFLDVISQGGARNGMAESKRDKLLSDQFAADFSMALMLKDLTLAERLAEELGLPMPGLALVKALYQSGCRTGGKDMDIAALKNTYRLLAGEKV